LIWNRIDRDFQAQVVVKRETDLFCNISSKKFALDLIPDQVAWCRIESTAKWLVFQGHFPTTTSARKGWIAKSGPFSTNYEEQK
jgi:hypothetical protein